VELSSVDFSIGLGKSARGPAGSIYLKSKDAIPELATPKALKVSTLTDAVREVRTSEGPRQVLAPQTLTDISVIDDFSYKIKVYSREEGTAPQVTNGVFVVPGGSTLLTSYTVANPDAIVGPLQRLRITEHRDNGDVEAEHSIEQRGRCHNRAHPLPNLPLG
jgi:hypothetical protein